jgi:hypothetical protein
VLPYTVQNTADTLGITTTDALELAAGLAEDAQCSKCGKPITTTRPDWAGDWTAADGTACGADVTHHHHHGPVIGHHVPALYDPASQTVSAAGIELITDQALSDALDQLEKTIGENAPGMFARAYLTERADYPDRAAFLAWMNRTLAEMVDLDADPFGPTTDPTTSDDAPVIIGDGPEQTSLAWTDCGQIRAGTVSDFAEYLEAMAAHDDTWTGTLYASTGGNSLRPVTYAVTRTPYNVDHIACATVRVELAPDVTIRASYTLDGRA